MFALKLLKNTKPFINNTRSLLHTTIPVCVGLKPPEKLTTLLGISLDRSEEIPVETSLKYMKSSAYQQTYGTDPVWKLYRRNHKGQIPPKKTRKTCIRKQQISTGNPCPICRDEYLVLHEHNLDLLKQFICPHTGSVLSFSKTGLCQKKHEQLLIVLKKARDLGLITFDVPFRTYNYQDYYQETGKTQQ